MKASSKSFLMSGITLLFLVVCMQTGWAEEYPDRVLQEFHTVVDFYTNIKGVEYIYCVCYIAIFPMLYITTFKE